MEGSVNFLKGWDINFLFINFLGFFYLFCQKEKKYAVSRKAQNRHSTNEATFKQTMFTSRNILDFYLHIYIEYKQLEIP